MPNTSFVQISDCHIGTKQNNINLAKVVGRIKNLAIKDIVMSGDLTANGTLSEYLQLQHILAPIQELNIYVLAGNHDNVVNMQKIFTPVQLNNFALGNYYIQLINSKVEGAVFGNIDIKTINISAKNSIIITHHPVLNMQSYWNDNALINNMAEFKNFMTKAHNIKMICFGHAHEAKTLSINATSVYSCPSSSYQFAGTKGFGFNIYKLDEDIKKTTVWL